MEAETSEYLATTMTCSRCREEKPLSSFSRKVASKTGRRPSCKQCNTTVARACIARGREQDAVSAWARRAVSAIRHRAKLKVLSFALTASMLAAKSPEYCPVLGVRLEYPTTFAESPGGKANSPSVDQIVAGAGYTDENTIIVSNRVNAIKRDATPDELLRIATFYRDLELSRNA